MSDEIVNILSGKESVKVDVDVKDDALLKIALGSLTVGLLLSLLSSIIAKKI